MDSVWKKYKETKDKELKNQLIEEYVYLVKIVAGRMYNFYGSKVEYDDLVGYGVFGLIDSIEKFDITKEIKFSTYAQIRIRGEIIDNIRRQDWIPRTLRTRSKELQDTIYKLENELGRNPTNEELAIYMDLPIKKLEEMLSEMSNFNIYSLDESITESGDYLLDIDNSNNNIQTPEAMVENKAMNQILSKAIDCLNGNEKMVISLYYYDELTYKEIGQVLELSESRISQIHSKAILNMKNYMENVI